MHNLFDQAERGLATSIARSPAVLQEILDGIDVEKLSSNTNQLVELITDFPTLCAEVGPSAVAAKLRKPEPIVQHFEDLERTSADELSSLPSLTDSLEILSRERPPEWDGAPEWNQGKSEPLPKPKRRFLFFSENDLESLSDPSWIIPEILPNRGIFEIHGRRGSAKSFFILDLLMSIATGRPYHGREVKPGMCVYVSVEAAPGLKLRKRAWREARGLTGPAQILFLTRPVLLMEPAQVQDFIRDLTAATPEPISIIAFDTLAKCMVGGDENSARDMGLFIDGAETIARSLKCLVGIVHHTGRSGEEERGSTALAGAADAMYLVSKDGSTVVVRCTKMKDHGDDLTLTFELEPAGDSMVLTAKTDWQAGVGNLTPNQRTALESLSRSFLSDGATFGQWLSDCGIPERSFYRVRTSLVTEGYVAEITRGRSKRYTVTDSGRQALPASLPTTCQPPAKGTPRLPAATPPSLRGGGNGRQSVEGSSEDSLL